MPDLPDPLAPLNEMDKKVFGPDTTRHPVTGFPIERGGACSESPSQSPSAQARNHIRMVAQTHGTDVAQAMLKRLEEWEAAAGTVELPSIANGLGSQISPTEHGQGIVTSVKIQT